MVLEFLPLLVVLALLSGVALVPTFPALDRHVTRLSYLLFSGLTVETDSRRERMLRSAGIGTPFRVYVTKTHLYTAIAALSGSVLGVYVAAIGIDVLGLEELRAPIAAPLFAPLPAALKTFSVKLFAVILATSLVVGVVAAATAYAVRWQIPAIRANARRRQVDASMPRMVAFIYALSRGGMAFPNTMRTLSRNRGIFGAGAEEMGVAARNMDLLGTDVVTAIRELTHRSPSEQFQTFGENLASVLQSGRNLASFLDEEYERFKEEAEVQQREILDLLATVAEVYVTVVVAGMLFLITILLVIGLTTGDTLVLVQLITYVILPATNVLFIAYLSEVTQPLRASRDGGESEGASRRDGNLPPAVTAVTATDGGSVSSARLANLERLRAHQRVRRIRSTLASPLDSAIDNPTVVLYVTVPLAALFVAAQFSTFFVDGRIRASALDDALIQAVLFVMATFALVYEVRTRRLRRLESSVPDLLERLASLNEAGVAVVSSFDRVRRSRLGRLDDEVERIWRDIQWGATVTQALDRFERRVQTPSVTRVVTLITNAMRASNEIGPVLRIAAQQARSDRRLERQRRQEMFTYLVVVYVAFIVFLVVIAAVDFVLIPNLPQAAPGTEQAAGLPGFGNASPAQIEAYRLVFFHAALIQAVLSGLVGGQMSGGSLSDGVKHATVMLVITYGVFLLAPRPTSGADVALALFPFA